MSHSKRANQADAPNHFHLCEIIYVSEYFNLLKMK